MSARPKIVLALGGGVARGWAHIGGVRELVKAGLQPDVVCGTSIGAVVGGLYVADKLDELEIWARSLTSRSISPARTAVYGPAPAPAAGQT